MYTEIQAAQFAIKTWLSNIDSRPDIKQTILRFIQLSVAVKLSKSETCTTPELPINSFSILRLMNKDNKAVFRLVTHIMIDEPGGCSKIKVVFPIALGDHCDTLLIDINVPMALKILRPTTKVDTTYPVPTLQAQEAYSTLFPTQYALAERETTSQKSRYPETHVLYQQDLRSKHKKYLCMPLFNAQPLTVFFKNISEIFFTEDGSGRGLAKDDAVVMMSFITQHLSQFDNSATRKTVTLSAMKEELHRLAPVTHSSTDPARLQFMLQEEQPLILKLK